MVELEVIKCIKSLNPQIKHIAGDQDGAHPTTVFCIVEKIDEYDIGEPTKTLKSKDGYWLAQQPKEIQVNIGFQGKYNTDAASLAQALKFQLELNPTYKFLFKQLGYSYFVGERIVPISMDMNTSRYIRHTLTLTLRTNISMPMILEPIESIKISKGRFDDQDGNKVHEYEEVIE